MSSARPSKPTQSIKIFRLVSESIWIFILLPWGARALRSRSRRCSYRAGLPELRQQRDVYEGLGGDSLRGWRRHYVDVKDQLPGGDLCRRIFRRVEARRPGHQGAALNKRSDECVRAGQERVDQRIRNWLIDELEHRELHRLLDYVHRAAHRDEVVGRGRSRIRGASVSPDPKARAECVEYGQDARRI